MDEKQLLRESVDKHIRQQIDNKKVDSLLVENQIRKLAELENERYTRKKD